MDKFEASNGYKIEIGSLGNIEIRSVLGDPRGSATVLSVDALREFFQHERDEELGRWRWPEHPDYVVLPRLRGWVCVISESTGQTLDARRGQYLGTEPTLFGAANAYFEAHPERKPWEDAKPGEVWAISTENVADEVAVRVAIQNETLTFEYVKSISTHLDASDKRIVSGRRIWPESD